MELLLTLDSFGSLRYGGTTYQSIADDAEPMLIEGKWLVLCFVLIAIACGLVIGFTKFGAGRNSTRISEGKNHISRAVIALICAIGLVSFVGVFYSIFEGFRF